MDKERISGMQDEKLMYPAPDPLDPVPRTNGQLTVEATEAAQPAPQPISPSYLVMSRLSIAEFNEVLNGHKRIKRRVNPSGW